MNEQIKELAEQVGWDMGDEACGFTTRLEKFAELVAAAERETIVKMIETHEIPEAVSAAGKTARLWTQTALERIVQKLREKNNVLR